MLSGALRSAKAIRNVNSKHPYHHQCVCLGDFEWAQGCFDYAVRIASLSSPLRSA